MNQDSTYIHCKQQAALCEREHAKWSKLDRYYAILFCISSIVLAFMSVVASIKYSGWVQAYDIFLCSVCLTFLRWHSKDKSTHQYLVHRQEWLDLANQIQ